MAYGSQVMTRVMTFWRPSSCKVAKGSLPFTWVTWLPSLPFSCWENWATKGDEFPGILTGMTGIWVNYNISLTWIKAIWGWFPLLTMIPRARSQWGSYNLPRWMIWDDYIQPGWSNMIQFLQLRLSTDRSLASFSLGFFVGLSSDFSASAWPIDVHPQNNHEKHTFW